MCLDRLWLHMVDHMKGEKQASLTGTKRTMKAEEEHIKDTQAENKQDNG